MKSNTNTSSLSQNQSNDTLGQEGSGLIDMYRNMLLIAGDQKPAVIKNLIFALLASIFEGLALLCFFPILQALFSTELNVDSLWLWVAIMSGLVVIESLFRWKVNKLNHSEHYVDVGHSLKMQVAKKLRALPLETLYSKRTGELTDVIAGNTEDVVMMMSTVATMVIRPIVVPAIMVLACLFISWPIAVLMLLLFPLSIPLYVMNKKILNHSTKQMMQANKTLVSDLVELTQGVSVLRSTGAIHRQETGIKQSIQHLENIQKKARGQELLPNFLLATLVELGLWLVVMLGVWLIFHQHLDIASLIAIVIITTRFAEPMTLFLSFAQGFDVFEKGLSSIRKMMQMPTLALQQNEQPAPSKPAEFSIGCEQLSYHYPDDKTNALNELTLSIPAKSMTALVGPSGCGKSTLIRMLMRYGDPQSGCIKIGGVDIRSLAQEELMSYFSVVFQDVYLFDESIYANIALGDASASKEDIIRAAKLAHCHDFIEQLPHGYDTVVGEIGSKLSGGEKQRISIARAILKNAPIVILDEPTAALDTESEVAVQKAIDTLVKDKTVIVIAHRLSTITHAKIIVVLEDGALVEQGGHESLMQQQGRYFDLWQAQLVAKVWRVNDEQDE